MPGDLGSPHQPGAGTKGQMEPLGVVPIGAPCTSLAPTPGLPRHPEMKIKALSPLGL